MHPTRTAADGFTLRNGPIPNATKHVRGAAALIVVHLARHGAKHTFRCQQCDFQVTFDAQMTAITWLRAKN